MGTGLAGWTGAVGSCLAIQAAILMAGSLLGLNQHLVPRTLPLKAASLPFDRSRLLDSAVVQLGPGLGQQRPNRSATTIR
jgi:hypothetical protein